MDSDDSSWPSVSSIDWYRDDRDVNGLDFAAQYGDIDVIQRVEERFACAFYCSNVARQAISHGHLLFFERFLLLCRWHMISIRDQRHEVDMQYLHEPVWEYYLLPFEDCLGASANDDIRLRALRIVFENFLPSLPSRAELIENLKSRNNQNLELPQHQHSIWSLNDFRTITNDEHGRRCMSFFSSVCDEKIFRYLAEVIGLKFGVDTLKFWSTKFNQRIYQFVLQHLDIDIDSNQIPQDCIFSKEAPNDADFFYFVLRCFGLSKYHSMNLDSCLVEFLENHPDFVLKIPALMRELQKLHSPKHLFQMNPKPHAILYPALRHPITIPGILSLLERIRRLIPNTGFEAPFDIYCQRKSGRDVHQGESEEESDDHSDDDDSWESFSDDTDDDHDNRRYWMDHMDVDPDDETDDDISHA